MVEHIHIPTKAVLANAWQRLPASRGWISTVLWSDQRERRERCLPKQSEANGIPRPISKMVAQPIILAALSGASLFSCSSTLVASEFQEEKVVMEPQSPVAMAW